MSGQAGRIHSDINNLGCEWGEGTLTTSIRKRHPHRPHATPHRSQTFLESLRTELAATTEPPTVVIKIAIVYKALAAILLLISAVGLLGLITDGTISAHIRTALIDTGMESDQRFLSRILITMGLISRRNATLLALVTLFYSLLEGIESVGLATRRRWAEYLTFVATVLLLPPELREVWLHPQPSRLLLLAANLALALYLVRAKRLFQQRSAPKREAEEGWGRPVDAPPLSLG